MAVSSFQSLTQHLANIIMIGILLFFPLIPMDSKRIADLY